jgi:hypothetical protein
MSRPSLTIIRHKDKKPPENVTFEVWNPITAEFQSADSLDDGLLWLDELAERVRLMWARQHRGRMFLRDAPDIAMDDDSEWAELRVNARSQRFYETRNFDQRQWKKAVSGTDAVERTCDELGYIPPSGIDFTWVLT